MRSLLVAIVVASLVAGCADRWGQPSQSPAVLPPVPGAAPPPAGQDALTPLGYGSQVIAAGLVDPRALVFTPDGVPLVVEGSAASLIAVQAGGTLVPRAMGGGNGPWTGAALIGHRIYVAEAGGPLGGRILAVDGKGGVRPLPVALPGGGRVGPLAAGPDGWLYVGIAASPEDSSAAPCRPRGGGVRDRGDEGCSGTILRISPDTGAVEAYAWGFHRPIGLAFTPAGRLMVADAVAPGDNPVWQVAAGDWYGWPPAAGLLAAAGDGAGSGPNPPPPAARVAGQVGALAVDHQPSAAFGPAGRAFIAVRPTGRPGEIAFVPPDGGPPQPFVTNLIRPAAIAFDPTGSSLWTVDGGTGRLWKISKFQ